MLTTTRIHVHPTDVADVHGIRGGVMLPPAIDIVIRDADSVFGTTFSIGAEDAAAARRIGKAFIEAANRLVAATEGVTS